MIIFLPFIIAFIITTIATPLCLIVIKKIGLLDDPKYHKHPGMIHKKPTPRGGGIPLLIGIVIAGILFLPFTKAVIALFVASLILFFLGEKHKLLP